MRPVGFYWVWINGGWVVAEHQGDDAWIIPGDDREYGNGDFERITAPITPPWTGYEPK